MEDSSMSATKNEREHVRKARDEKILFQITSSAHDTLPPGTVVRCSTKDISPRGISLQLDRPLSEGSQLELGVELLDQPGVLFLAGEVKWCKVLDESKRRFVGVELRERQAGDLKLWQGVLNR
jgi:hypothetical protein